MDQRVIGSMFTIARYFGLFCGFFLAAALWGSTVKQMDALCFFLTLFLAGMPAAVYFTYGTAEKPAAHDRSFFFTAAFIAAAGLVGPFLRIGIPFSLTLLLILFIFEFVSLFFTSLDKISEGIPGFKYFPGPLALGVMALLTGAFAVRAVIMK